jgi:hypothetical protein
VETFKLMSEKIKQANNNCPLTDEVTNSDQQIVKQNKETKPSISVSVTRPHSNDNCEIVTPKLKPKIAQTKVI